MKEKLLKVGRNGLDNQMPGYLVPKLSENIVSTAVFLGDRKLFLKKENCWSTKHS